MPYKAVVRLGSLTELPHIKYELNSTNIARLSGNKQRTKEVFTRAGASTANWLIYRRGSFFKYDPSHRYDQVEFDLKFPVVVKELYGSKNRGNTLVHNMEDLNTVLSQKSSVLIEEYKNYIKEYRLHVSALGCFYTCRKMLKRDTPKEQQWFRNDSNCVWFLESNPSFDKPANWDELVRQCQTVLTEMGADFLAFDVRMSAGENARWILLETNSAPSFGEGTLNAYLNHIPKLLNHKYN